MTGTEDNGTSPCYVYKPLKDPSTDIRLITFARGAQAHDGGPSMLSLSHWLLQDPPLYVALSYAWGPTEPISTIQVDDMVMKVSQNCFDALYRLMSAVSEPSGMETFTNTLMYYWIDSICIDQANLLEKSTRVQMMASIYVSAACVTIWLGMTVGEEYACLLKQDRAYERFLRDKARIVRRLRTHGVTLIPYSGPDADEIALPAGPELNSKDRHRKSRLQRDDSTQSRMRETLCLDEGMLDFDKDSDAPIDWYRRFDLDLK